MKTIKTIYSEIDNEVFDLIDQFRLEIIKEYGLKSKSEEKLMKFIPLSIVLTQLAGCSNTRLILADTEETMGKTILSNRKNSFCPNCLKNVKIKIIGQERIGKLHFMHDKVVCRICSNEFYSLVPNNIEERYLFAERIVSEIPDYITKEEETLNRPEKIKDLKHVQKKMQDQKDGITDCRNLIEKNKKILIKLEGRVKEVRDFLLDAKQNGMDWDEFTSLVIDYDSPNCEELEIFGK